jgi:RNA polymerase sigma-70 factor (ECF subfamily)
MLNQLPAGDQFADVLETSRRFLLAIANAELPQDLRAKGGASDLVQETLTAAHRCRLQFEGSTVADLRAWLRAILANELAIFRRRYAGTAARDVSREVALTADVPGRVEDRSPVADLIRAEREQQIAAAVARLPDEVRLVILLRVEHGQSFGVIGARIGKTEDAVRKVFTRGITQLRGLMPAVVE